ncbi:vWA domain-containing protein [Butyrivibrio sp. MC2013]|uniref:vWA domain-containing protein n=1 Tax=Butyrivibrio sp. MC2013 TaxID=1280686 RepID=UPI0004196002|nr:von Willebrand factor type A domain-containing protein [Butyrivibrio sp. MC2013]
MKKKMLVTMITSTSILAGALTGCGASSYVQETTSSSDQIGTGSNKGAIRSDSSDKATVETMPIAEEASDYDYAVEGDTAYDMDQPVLAAQDAGATAEAMAEDCWIYYDEPTGETYQEYEENGYSLAQTTPLSTFAADVDTASYANVRRMIEDGYYGMDIDPAAVRPEEFINYFHYDLKGPSKGNKFGVTTEVSACPWNEDHQLMFVGVKAEDKLDGKVPESNLVFLIDVSGSMDSRDKLDLLKTSLKDMIDNIDCKGTMSIVTYASQEEVLLDGVSFKDKKDVINAIDNLYADGATNGEKGIQMAYEIAERNYIEGGNNRIIMCTDGDLNVGINNPDDLEKFIKEKKESGVFLSVLGFGDGNYRDDMLERVADYGNGNYSYIDSKLEGHKVLVEEMTSTLVTVAKDVKFQIEFNPAKVNSYRLIGYENRVMDAADFNDDSKDGGEMGAGHTVVALYEIVPADGKDAIELKYQNGTDSASDDYATLKLRYKEPDGAKSRLETYVVDKKAYKENAGENLTFAGLVAEFALILGDSDHAGSASLDHIRNEFKNLKNIDEYQEEFYQLVRLVEKRG